MGQVSAFLVELGTNVISDNVQTLSQALLTLKINIQLSQSIKSKVQFILYLFRICEMMILDIICQLSNCKETTLAPPPPPPPSPISDPPSPSPTPSPPGPTPSPPSPTPSPPGPTPASSPSSPTTLPPAPPTPSTSPPCGYGYGVTCEPPSTPTTTRGPIQTTTFGYGTTRGYGRSNMFRRGIWNRHRGIKI